MSNATALFSGFRTVRTTSCDGPAHDRVGEQLAVHPESLAAGKVADPTRSRDFIQLVASPGKALHLVRGSVHAPLDDLGQEDTRHVILTWLAGRLPSGSRRPFAHSAGTRRD
jgi:hypothetical protein